VEEPSVPPRFHTQRLVAPVPASYESCADRHEMYSKLGPAGLVQTSFHCAVCACTGATATMPNSATPRSFVMTCPAEWMVAGAPAYSDGAEHRTFCTMN